LLEIFADHESPICQKQVLTSTLQDIGADVEQKVDHTANRPSVNSFSQTGGSATLRELYLKDIDEDEMSYFKRVVQEVFDTLKARNRRLQPTNPSQAAGPSSSVRPFSGRFDEAMPVIGGPKQTLHVEGRSPSSRLYSGLFHSAMPLNDGPEDSQQSSGASSHDTEVSGSYKVLYLAASLFAFDINATRLEAGYPYLTYHAGEVGWVYWYLYRQLY
jgi:hypothetical protein